MTVTALVAESLACLRGGRLLFRDLGFRVAAGEAVALEGPNGAGKSSLLRMLGGFLAPASGTIAFETAGGSIIEAEERGRLVGWLGHLDAAKPQMTVTETLRFYAALHGSPAEAIPEALAETGLARLADLPCQYLSAGQKKRLALARLAGSNRPLWLMDEPLAALDAEGKKLAAALVAAHCAEGGLAVIATHEPLGIPCAKLALGAVP